MNAKHEPSVIVPRSIYAGMTIPPVSDDNDDPIKKILLRHPEVIEWNQDGEYTYRGHPIKGSNLSEMLRTCQARAMKEKRGPGFQEFYKALADCDAPQEAMKNRASKNLLKLYKLIKNKRNKKAESSQKMITSRKTAKDRGWIAL